MDWTLFLLGAHFASFCFRSPLLKTVTVKEDNFGEGTEYHTWNLFLRTQQASKLLGYMSKDTNTKSSFWDGSNNCPILKIVNISSSKAPLWNRTAETTAISIPNTLTFYSPKERQALEGISLTLFMNTLVSQWDEGNTRAAGGEENSRFRSILVSREQAKRVSV